MRFVFRTSYRQEMGLFRDPVQRNWYVALLVGLLALPLLVPSYLVDISLVFIYGLCGLSLMVLAGYTGLVSLGHAAFLGIGAYAHVYFVHDLGLPWLVSVALASVVTAAAGVLVGLPALRMTGVYLSIATLAFALIIQEVLTRWERVTGSLKGKPVDKPVVFGVYLGGDAAFYFLCLVFLIAGLWLTGNLLRSPTGRAWVAIRDSEIAAQSMGVNLAVYKTSAFAYSAALMGVAGALFAHKIGFLAPDIFTVLLSIQFLLMVVVGGLGSLHGALFGADGLVMDFGGLRAVDGVSFQIEPGEVFTIIGPNGAGKTTIFNLVSRIYEPTAGRLIFDGEDITRVPPHEVARRGIARTFQNIELFPHATVPEHLLTGRHG